MQPAIIRLSFLCKINDLVQDLTTEELEESFDHVDEVVKIDGVIAILMDEES
jgi:hypothetical protein